MVISKTLQLFAKRCTALIAAGKWFSKMLQAAAKRLVGFVRAKR
jgi:hypothetical protein